MPEGETGRCSRLDFILLTSACLQELLNIIEQYSVQSNVSPGCYIRKLVQIAKA